MKKLLFIMVFFQLPNSASANSTPEIRKFEIKGKILCETSGPMREGSPEAYFVVSVSLLPSPITQETRSIAIEEAYFDLKNYNDDIDMTRNAIAVYCKMQKSIQDAKNASPPREF